MDSYPGGKAQPGVYQQLINQIPPHETFPSCFLGNCAVTRHKRPAARTIGLDLDPAVLLRWHARQFPGLELFNSDATAFLRSFFSLEAYPRRPNTPQNPRSAFVYCDPPYPHATRTKRRVYRHEMSDQQHEELCATLLQLPCPTMISTYPNPLYTEAFHDWRSFDYQAITRGGTKRTERVYMNYGLPDALHDYQHWGTDKRHREAITRRKKNLRRLLLSRDAFERYAVLQYVQDLYSSTEPDPNDSEP